MPMPIEYIKRTVALVLWDKKDKCWHKTSPCSDSGWAVRRKMHPYRDFIKEVDTITYPISVWIENLPDGYDYEDNGDEE